MFSPWDKVSFTSLNMVSSVTSTSTFGIPVFSDIWLTRSAFLMSHEFLRVYKFYFCENNFHRKCQRQSTLNQFFNEINGKFSHLQENYKQLKMNFKQFLCLFFI